MSEHILVLIKKVDNIDAIINSDIVQSFKNEYNTDLDIDDKENRYTSIYSEINDYDAIIWTDDMNSLKKRKEIKDVLNSDIDIVSSADKHLLIVKDDDNVKKLMYHWSQSTKDIYTTQRWKNETIEMESLNIDEDKVENSTNDKKNNVTESVNNIINKINNINERWLLIFLIILLIIVAMKL